MNDKPFRVLSLGAGVQSSTLALMIAAGEIEPIECAVFADTQAEPASVYEWLDWLETQLPFPIHRVSGGNLETDSVKMRFRSRDGEAYTRTAIPFYMRNPDGSVGKTPWRQCTADYKIRPILKAVRKLAKVKRGQKTIAVTQLIGISLDEVSRMKPSREPWCEHEWPLVDRRMTRQHCLEWMAAKGYPKPPRSACVFCPFHNSDEWRRLKNEDPKEFARAVKFEKDVQATKAQTANMRSTPYLHRSAVPLDEVDFSVKEDPQLNFFENECEGMCGV